MADTPFFESSENIIVFPAANRTANDDNNISESSKLTEYRFSRQLISLINNLEIDGFVLSNSTDAIEDGDSLSFILAGHCFEIHDVTNLLDKFSDSSKIYAQLNLRTVSNSQKNFKDQKTDYNDLDFAVLDGFTLNLLMDSYDITSGKYTQFNGVRFCDEKLSSKGSSKELLILEKIDESWYVPGESKILFVPGYDKTDKTYEDAFLCVSEDGLFWEKSSEEEK